MSGADIAMQAGATVSALNAAVKAARALQEKDDGPAAEAKWAEIRALFPDAQVGYLAAARLLRKKRRLKEAEAILSAGLENCPSSEGIAVDWAWISHHAGNWEEADRRWTAVRQRFPDCFNGYFGGGATLRALGRFEEAEHLYAHALVRWPEAANLLADYAALAEARGDKAEAARRWDDLRQRFPGDPASYVQQARTLRAAGDLSAAEAILTQGAARCPKIPEILVERARTAQQRGASAEALERWEAVIELHNGGVEGYLGAATALNELGRFAEAEAVLQPALRMHPDSAALATVHCWIAHYRKDFAEAAARWARLRERFPGHVPGFAGGSVSLMALGKREEASMLVEEGLRRFPDDVHMAMEWARLPQETQDWEQAEPRWKHVYERFGSITRVQAGYATALYRNGKPQEAERVAEASIAAQGPRASLLRVLAECASAKADWPLALQRWRAVVDHAPERWNSWMGLVETLRDAGSLDESDRVLDDALARFPCQMELERQRAVTATLRRDWPTALALWEDLKRRYPEHPSVLGAITQALWQAQQDLGVAISAGEKPPFEIPSLLLEAAPHAEAEGPDLAALFNRFESLGDTCEFGMVQRRFGSEPISLLRWASTPPAKLVMALNTRFEGVGEAAFTIIETIKGEYVSRDSRYHMFNHSFTPETAEPFERFSKSHLRRMQFLRRKLIEDLEAGEKIFVYKCIDGLSDTAANAIYKAMEGYGGRPALLCVRIADSAHPAGTLAHIRDGLFMGYTDRFSTVNINVDVWVSLCQAMAAQWHGLRHTEQAA